MFQKLLNIRFVIILVVGILFINSIFFIIGGTVYSVKGYIEFTKNGFMPSETLNPGLQILKGLDAFMLAIIFIIFGLGIARLFLFNSASEDQVPSWLRFSLDEGTESPSLGNHTCDPCNLLPPDFAYT